MVEVKLSENLKEKFPDIKIGILEVRNIVNRKFDSKLEEEKRKVEKFIRENYTDIENIETIQKYDKFFKKFEKTYPIRFQIKSVLNGRNIPSVSTIVETMFMAELKNMFLTAGHDLDKIKGNIETKLSKGGETYTKINQKEQELKSDDLISLDEESVISSVLYGPDSRTKITENTKNCLFFSYFPYGESDEDIKKHFNDILDNIKIFSDQIESSEIMIYSL
jgi:DNA/RNA-binding domain of Phe-tRNA-synthetase-like protein